MWSTSFHRPGRPPPPKRTDGFVVGPFIYNDNTDAAAHTSRSSRTDGRINEYSPTPTLRDAPTFRRSPDSSGSTKRSKRSCLRKVGDTSKTSKKSKKSIREADLRRERSDYEKRKRAKILELSKQAEQDHEKLMLQRTRAEQTAREIEASMGTEQEARDRSMAMMKKQLEGMDWRSSRDLKDVRREIEEWKEKTAKSGELAQRVDSVEKRVEELEKADAERKKTIDMVEKNWVDFGRLKTQSMALEIMQIKNRRGAKHLEKMPKEVAETTSSNLYKLCADLQRLTFHLNQKNEVTRLVDEAITLAEAIAPLYGAKEDFVDSRENTSCTNVSIASVQDSPADTTSTSPGGSALTSPSKAPIRENLRRAGRDPATVSIPPQSKFDPKYAGKENLFIDAPSLREPSPNYYSDQDFKAAASKAAQANSESAAVATPVEPTVTPQPASATPPAAPVAAAAAAPAAPESPTQAPAAPPAAAEPPTAPTEAPAAEAAAPVVPTAAAAAPVVPPSPASISLSVDSDSVELKKAEKKKSRSRLSSAERIPEEAKPE